MNDYKREYKRWLDNLGSDERTKNELISIESNEKEQEERFYTELEFGTAGLRGIIGAGTNRMNDYVVRRASAGLAKYLIDLSGSKERGVAIAYDSRNHSDTFAKETACTLAAFGIKCYLYTTLHSVPQLSFTVRELHCIAGVVITASHNPPEYNGYKVYWEHGGQCGPAQADEILARIRTLDYFGTPYIDFDEATKRGLIVPIGGEMDEIYYEKTLSLRLNADIVCEHGGDMCVVYTPLHGSGCVPVIEVLKRAGIKKLHVVEAQSAPDGNFPTVSAPNPEDPNAFTLAYELADAVKADIVLATDPDSDRLGVAVRTDNGSFTVLSGNQIGSVLIHYILSTLERKNSLPKDGFVVKSLVSTGLADAICRRFGISIKHVLTGFRFIAEQIDFAEASGEGTFLFGFEESYGFLAGGFSHDKDAILAAMLVAEAAVVYALEGKTLYDVLQDIYRIYGTYVEKTKSYTLCGKEGLESIAKAMSGLRNDPPASFGAERVIASEDFSADLHVNCISGAESPIGMPRSNILRYFLEDDAWVIARPSGTEPKLKLYIGVSADSAEAAQERMRALLAAADERVSALLKG